MDRAKPTSGTASDSKFRTDDSTAVRQTGDLAVSSEQTIPGVTRDAGSDCSGICAERRAYSVINVNE